MSTLSEHDNPVMPEVMCGEHGFAHAVCVIAPSYFLGGYDCYCPTCRNLDEGDDDGRVTIHYGNGDTPLEAAEDYASAYGGLQELTIAEQHV